MVKVLMKLIKKASLLAIRGLRNTSKNK